MTLPQFLLTTKICKRNGRKPPRPKDISRPRWRAMMKQYAQLVSMAVES